MTELSITDHAVRRFRERVRPALDFDAAERELLRLINDYGDLTEGAPAWLDGAAVRAKAYLSIGDQIALPLRADFDGSGGLVAVTCVHRGGIDPAGRRRRAEERRRRRASKRGRRMGRRRDRRPSPVPELDLPSAA